jgi:radical SAM superfamily enzyme YgiQ (UPF0313 family)
MGEKLDRYISPKPEIEIGPRFSGKSNFRILFLNANLYELGIANLGWQIIVYYILSNFPDVSIRVEYVDTLPPLHWNEFDLIAVSAPFETIYPNIIKMLYRIGLPLFRKMRRDPMPIVVAGGILNPYPLVDFIDVFVFGDGRKPLAEIIDFCRSGMSRNRILEILSGPRYRNMGIFVPEFHKSGEKIFANPELPLNEYPIHTIWSSRENPYGFREADYLSIMVALGCDRKCPFCAVSYCQGLLPKREDKHLSVEKILEILEWRRKFGKVNIVKLFFASSIRSEELKEILRELKKKRVEVRVGSLNILQIDEELLELLKVAGPNRVIIAPETNEEQRWKVNKGYITDERIFEIVGLCNKYSLAMTLYLMHGLPGEKNEDMKKLGELVRKIRKSLNKNLDLKVYNVPLFPKSHTPFEFAEQIPPEDNQRRFSLFKEGLRGLANLEIKTEDPDLALLQALLSRGDSRLKRLLITLSVRSGVGGLIQEIGKILPNWREYLREREDIPSLPWKDIIFSQPHEVLFSRWQTIKNKLN